MHRSAGERSLKDWISCYIRTCLYPMSSCIQCQYRGVVYYKVSAGVWYIVVSTGVWCITMLVQGCGVLQC